MSGPTGAPRTASSPEHPWPVRTVSTKIADWLHRLGQVWVEGQITQISRRPRTAFVVLRDPSVDMSLTVTCRPEVLDRSEVPLVEGSRVVMCGRPNFYTGRGTLSLQVTEIRPIGIGELLARLERLRRLLAAEGLFEPRIKRPLPFLPGRVGLITARASAAQHDVTSVATARWPAVRFDIRNTAVQGPTAVPQILRELAALDADEAVDVIILARGGGSVEDLLPFSDEALCRAVAACTTPVISAIGHEPDSPLLDLVADVRAPTPTAAAKLAVPDVVGEYALLDELRSRSARALRNWVHRESAALQSMRGRRVLADPLRMLDDRSGQIDRMRRDIRRDATRLVAAESDSVAHLAARLSTLGPAQTLARGYAVVQRVSGSEAHVVESVQDMPIGSQLRVRVADGAVNAAVMGVER